MAPKQDKKERKQIILNENIGVFTKYSVTTTRITSIK